MFVTVFDQGEFTPEKLGGKGFGLWAMQNKGINVPPALIIPTDMCVQYMSKPKTVMKDIEKNLWRIHEFFHKQFGYQPLMSVRSGARVSMPGMMDTILNVGLTEQAMPEWFERLPQPCVQDSMLRLIEMYGSVVKGLDRHKLTEARTVENRLKLYKELTGEEFPNAKDQLLSSIEAVFKSWNNDRAKVYRKLHDIPENWGTAVVIQAMVFGNMNDQSGTGVMFTRNPDTGEAKLTGEFLINAQGEDVVAGIRTPMPLSELSNWNDAIGVELQNIGLKLETDAKQVQDIEFTVQDGKLYILQTRTAKRGARAAIRFAIDMFKEDLITRKEAIKRVSLKEYVKAQQAVIDPSYKEKPSYIGIAACTGVAKGIIVKTRKAAIDCKQPCILVTQETTPDDIEGMIAAKGIVTMTGGATSHAAVVARGMNKPCVVGLTKDLSEFKEGATITICGATGRVWKDNVPVIAGDTSDEVAFFTEMLFAEAGAVPIDTKFAGKHMMLDMTGMLLLPKVEFLHHLRLVLNKCDKLLIDVRHKDDYASFYSMFDHPASIAQMVADRISELSSIEQSRIRVVTPAIKAGFPQIRQVTTLEDLVMAEGEFIMSGSLTEPMKRVLNWRQEDNVQPIALGDLVPGQTSYVTKERLAQILLS